MCCFFFSSRRRHTRWPRDWSSDVCSSDLTINKITDTHGKVIFERDDTDGEQKLDPQSAFILTQLMTGMFDSELDGYMAVTGSTIADELTRTYAGKTGTTNAERGMNG